MAADLPRRGIKGARARDGRPGPDALLMGEARREFDIVAAWPVLTRATWGYAGDELAGRLPPAPVNIGYMDSTYSFRL